MKKYRIVKIEDRQQTYFWIQERFLFWWVQCTITEKYFEYQGRALIIGRRYRYHSLDQAKNILNKIQNPYKEFYKGNKMVRVFGDVMSGLTRIHFGDVYINKSRRRYWNGHFTYEFSETLEGLMKIIDNRTERKKITIIA